MQKSAHSPTVSAIMAVYNGAPYVAAAVESILNQTFADFEFIVIDDGSTDSTLEILQHYAALDPRIRLISRENRGVPKSANEGIAAARGLYIARMDSDDISEPTRFELQVKFLEQNPDYMAVGTSGTVMDPEGNIIGETDCGYDHHELQVIFLTGNRVINGSAMYRASTGFLCNPELAYSSDYDFWARMSLIGKIRNLPDRLYRRRKHQQSITNTKNARQRELCIAISDQFCETILARQQYALLMEGYLQAHGKKGRADHLRQLLQSVIPAIRSDRKMRRQCLELLNSNANNSTRWAFRNYPLFAEICGLLPASLWIVKHVTRLTLQRRLGSARPSASSHAIP